MEAASEELTEYAPFRKVPIKLEQRTATSKICRIPVTGLRRVCGQQRRGRGMASRAAVVKWLLDSDPSIRWQVMRDLTDEPDEAVAAERARVATEGWGAQLLGLQTPDGHWSDDTAARLDDHHRRAAAP